MLELAKLELDPDHPRKKEKKTELRKVRAVLIRKREDEWEKGLGI
jgi:hypothetical protein